jgi:hypothetical protein
MRSYRRLLALVPLLSVPLGAVNAQELWPGISPANFRFDLAKPSFENIDPGFFTVTGMPMVRFKLGSAYLVADLPFASYAAGSDAEESDFRIGNPYLGVEARKKGSPFLLQFGGRLPLADEGDNGAALAVGLLSDWDHVEAWYPDLVPITASVVYERVTAGGLAVGARLGGSGFFYTGDDSEDTDFLVNYGLRLGYEKNRAVLAAMFTGRWVATSEDADDSSQQQLGFEAGYRFGSVMPMLSFRLPLDDPLKETTNSVFGIGLKAWW